MLDTPLGIIQIKVDDVITQCDFVELCTERTGGLGLPLFKVSGRYKAIIKTTDFLLPFSCTCEFSAHPEYDDTNVEPGEQLVLKSWYRDNLKISIGTEDDENNDKGFSVECLDDGLRIIANRTYKMNELVFCVAWTYLSDVEKEDIYTWFAADPSYSEEHP